MRVKIIFISVSLFLISGCSSYNEEQMDKLGPQTVGVGKHFYRLLQAENYDSLYKMFSARYYRTYSKEITSSAFEDMRKRFGAIVNVEFKGTEIRILKENGIKRTELDNKFEVTHHDGYVSYERLLYLIEDTTSVCTQVDGYSFNNLPHE